MPLPEDWKDSGEPCTAESLTEDLAALGVGFGSVILLHASLSSLGWVCGGATAVVIAMLRALGPDGTLVVPTMTDHNRDPSSGSGEVPESWWPMIRASMPAFDPAITPSRNMGAVAEQVRCWPGSRRSAHPQSSFAALGPAAADVVSDHDPTCHLGERSPLASLERWGAHVLLLGVGYDRCTCFHLAEYRRTAPAMREYSCVVGEGEPDEWGLRKRRWFTYLDVDLDDSDFAELGRAFDEESPRVRTGNVGKARAKLFPLVDAVTFATEWLPRNRRTG